MRKVVSIGLMIVLGAGAESGVLAAAQTAGPQLATVTGTARGSAQQPLSGARVQIRSTKTGALLGHMLTSETGDFSFTGLPAGDYVVEVVDASGRILGISTPFTLEAGVTASTSVTAVASGAAATSTSSGFSLLGMGPVTSMVVLGAASAASVAAVVATRSDASPSR